MATKEDHELNNVAGASSNGLQVTQMSKIISMLETILPSLTVDTVVYLCLQEDLVATRKTLFGRQTFSSFQGRIMTFYHPNLLNLPNMD